MVVLHDVTYLGNCNKCKFVLSPSSLVPQKGLLPVTMLTTKIYDEFTNVSFDYSFGSVFSSLLVTVKST